MTANPLTDQIIAAFDETERDNPPPPWTRQLLENIADTLVHVVPEIDPAIIGTVLMHTGAIFNTMANNDPTTPEWLRPPAIFAANILIGTGGRLHHRTETSGT